MRQNKIQSTLGIVSAILFLLVFLAPPVNAEEPGIGSASHGKTEGSKSKQQKMMEGSGSKSGHGGKGGYSQGKKEGSRSKKHGGYGRHRSGHHKKRDPFGHVFRFQHQLGLTDAQLTQLREARLTFAKAKIEAKAAHKIAHLELSNLVHSSDIDESAIRAVGAKIVASKTKKINAMIDAKLAILKILTAEQRKKVGKMYTSH